MNVQNVDIGGDMKPTVISLFAGCGGSSLGYKLAGFRELLAIDWDDNSEQTFNLNFPDVTFWNKNVMDVSAEDILESCNIKKGELDILDGSPPCQGFSTAGKRNVSDSRNDLFKEYIRLVDGLRPKIFVMENVSGMIKGSMKGRFIEIMKDLKGLDYDVKCKLLNAANYDVPQSRQRLFFIGIRKDLNKMPVFPIPSDKTITVKEAIKDLDLNDLYLFPTELAKNWWKLCKAGNSFSSIHPKGHWFNQQKISPNKPAPTITKSVFVCGRAGLAHWEKPGQLSIPMLKRLASFPDDFKFTGKFEEQWARIGNAVMPNQMKAIAETLKKEILDKSTNRQASDKDNKR